jgi:hypothetical protein
VARRPTQRQIFEALEARFGPEVAAAFTQSVDDLRAGVSLADVIAALEVGDIEAALSAFNLNDAAMRPLQRSVALAYETAGGQYAALITAAARQAGLRTVMRFNLTNPRAERWLREMSSRNVTNIITDQREAIREALRAGMAAGRGPRNTALDIVGRVNQQTGRRVGGTIGLTSQQSGYVATARAELASGDPDLMRNYLTRSLRDKRFDPAVRRAIANGTKLDADTITRAAGRYSDRLLKLRGDTIARTESLAALNAGQSQAFRQSVDDGLVDPDALEKEWDSAGDGRVRDTHADMDGQTVGIGQAFVSPSGARMMHPLDSSLGAPASEIIACRCRSKYRIDHFRGLE